MTGASCATYSLEWDVIADALADVRAALGPGRPVDVEIHLNAVSLARSHGFSFYDAMIVAAALAAGCGRLRHLADGGPSGRTACRRPDRSQSLPLNGRPVHG